jgi:hypothetical protein
MCEHEALVTRPVRPVALACEHLRDLFGTARIERNDLGSVR